MNSQIRPLRSASFESSVAPDQTIHLETLARARVWEAHLGAFRRELFGVPGAAQELLQHWHALRRAGRETAVLAAGCGDGSDRDWSRHIDSQMRRIERLLSRREPLIGMSGRAGEQRERIEDEIERVASAAGFALDVAVDVYRSLRALRAAPRSRGVLELRRARGLNTPAGRVRIWRAGRALERLEGVRREVAADHLEFVARRARDYRNLGVSAPDLDEAGTVALLRAIETFDYRSGIDMEMHATGWVEDALKRAVREASAAIPTRPQGFRAAPPN